MVKQKSKFAIFLDEQRLEIENYVKEHYTEGTRSELAAKWVELYAKSFRDNYKEE